MFHRSVLDRQQRVRRALEAKKSARRLRGLQRMSSGMHYVRRPIRPFTDLLVDRPIL
jgi:hypothetical protein